MTFNVHCLLHIVQSNTAFPFESFLFTRKLYVTATKQLEQQMDKKALDILHYKYRNRYKQKERKVDQGNK